jgi:hypothetical protein
MVETKDVILAIFAASPALGALVLVFLALAAGALQSLSTASGKVKLPYKFAGSVSLLGFLLGLVCGGLGLWWLTLHQPHRVYDAEVVIFLVQLGLLALAAGQVAYETIFSQ